MANLSDLINKAKSAKPLKDVLGLADAACVGELADTGDRLLEQIAALESQLNKVPDEVLKAQALLIAKDLQQLTLTL